MGSRLCWSCRLSNARRLDVNGEPVLLEAQDRSTWDEPLIRQRPGRA